MKKHKKLKWQLINERYDLIVKNPEVVDVSHLANLFEVVEDGSANWRKNMRFNQRAAEAFRQWFCNPRAALPGYAYALLSNWFLTSLKFIRESPRGQAALKLWSALFCAIPEIPEGRLTDPELDYKILPEKFKLWLLKQLRCQDDC
jgi:hypothetical protein